jgi:hypothetical protein
MGKLVEGYSQKTQPVAADVVPIIDSENLTMGADGSNSWATIGSIPGVLLATHYYAPSSQVTYNANTTTLTIMDGTNLTLSFTVPASGNVDIMVSADWAFATVSVSSAVDMFLAIVKHATVGTIYGLKSWIGNDNSLVCGANSTHRYNLTGLTPGLMQIDLAMGCSGSIGGGGSFANFYAGTLPVGALTSDPSNPIFIQAFAA